MLLDNSYTIIPQLRFVLTYTNDIRKVVTVKTDDVVNVFYTNNGEKLSIIGKVTKIGCDFNSSLGVVGTSAYMQIDGSSEYAGQVVYISPNQVISLEVVSTTGDIDNPVCSVDNEDQKVVLVRENEAGVFQYSKDGLEWHSATGDAGMSAYECAVKVGGFQGTEEEWLESLKGPQGPVGEPGSTKIDKIFTSVDEAEKFAINIEKGHVVALLATPSSLLYARNEQPASINGGTSGIMCIDGKNIPDITGYDYLGEIALTGESAYQTAVRLGFSGSEEEWLASLKGADGAPGESAYETAVALGFIGTTEDWIASLKGEPGDKGADGKSAYETAKEAGFEGTEEEFAAKLAGEAIVVDSELSDTSVNPVQNKVISAKVNDIQKQINAITAGSAENPVVVADTYFGDEADLKHAVYGPIRLVVYGKTTPGTMESIAINTIDIYDNDENHQTLQLPEPITLRSVPCLVGSCPNVEIDGTPHVADFICEKDGIVGVTRRIAHVDNYSGECIIGDYLSSTGDLDLGAEVQYVVYGEFEPLPEDVQEQWKTFHSYEGEFHIRTTEPTNISVTYPIDVITYIDEAIKNNISGDYGSYIEQVVSDVVDEKIGTDLEGQTITTYIENTISNRMGDIPAEKTVAQYVTETVEANNTSINESISQVSSQVTTIQQFIGENEETSLSELVTKLVNEALASIAGEFGDLTIKEYIDQQDSTIDQKIGTLPESQTSVVGYIGEIPAGQTVSQYVLDLIDSETFGDDTAITANTLSGHAKVASRKAVTF